MTEKSNTDNQHPAGYEKKDVHIGKTVWMTVISVIAIIVMVVLLNEYFVYVTEEIRHEHLLVPESTDLLNHRANEESVLKSLQLLDSAKGTYRVPIEQAMELIAAEAVSGK